MCSDEKMKIKREKRYSAIKYMLNGYTGYEIPLALFSANATHYFFKVRLFNLFFLKLVLLLFF